MIGQQEAVRKLEAHLRRYAWDDDDEAEPRPEEETPEPMREPVIIAPGAAQLAFATRRRNGNANGNENGNDPSPSSSPSPFLPSPSPFARAEKSDAAARAGAIQRAHARGYSREELEDLSPDRPALLAHHAERWAGLRNPYVLVREVGAEALREGLLALWDELDLGMDVKNPAGRLVYLARQLKGVS